MKRTIVVLLLLAFVGVVCAGNMIYVKHSLKDITSALNQTIEGVKANQTEQAKQGMITTDTLWQKHRKIYMMFIEQDLLDEVDTQMAQLKALLQYHQEEFLPSAMICLSHLEEIHQRESISYYSWF